MLTRRIIPCLDVHHGRVTKCVQFVNRRDVGDPADLSAYYNEQGADELVFYDITASSEERDIMLDAVRRTAEQVFIPLTVGGGLRTADDMHRMLRAGADKVSINSSALTNPQLIAEGADRFGSQCIVLSMDVKRVDMEEPHWHCYLRGGRVPTDVDACEWAQRGVELGAGEIVVNSIDGDGMLDGYDLPLLRTISDAVEVPVVASGGAGKLEHFSQALHEGQAHAVLAASVFHYGTFTIGQVKDHLAEQGVPVRQ
ncbi:MAG: imidazole glycerol phosphate synthase subunit HisF [Dehalococcoidia bacterium]|nr:imidazole glycerol phosphate synthase subunit HisF [Dehalococcoidia bacterium]